MKHFLLILPLVLFSMPAMAAEPLTPIEAVKAAAEALSAEEKERLNLAIKMHEIWPIRTRMEAALESVAANFPEDKQTEIKAAMRKSIKFDQLEEESIKAMADVFTSEELKAMIDFYGSDTGRAISAKTGDYEMAMRPVMTRMIDAAMLDLKTGQPR